nr:MAG TPA: hypothetical protein [Caudoviricetes sp.]
MEHDCRPPGNANTLTRASRVHAQSMRHEPSLPLPCHFPEFRVFGGLWRQRRLYI